MWRVRRSVRAPSLIQAPVPVCFYPAPNSSAEVREGPWGSRPHPRVVSARLRAWQVQKAGSLLGLLRPFGGGGGGAGRGALTLSEFHE